MNNNNTYTATLTPHIFSYPVLTLRKLSLLAVRSLRYPFEQGFYACEVVNEQTGELIYSFTHSTEMFPTRLPYAEAVQNIVDILDYLENRDTEDEDEDEVDTYWDEDDEYECEGYGADDD